MVTLLAENDVIENSKTSNYEGQIMVLKPEALAKDYRTAEFQVFKATGGFGCDPNKLGSAVFGTFLADGEYARMERPMFMGVIKPESYEQWKKMYKEA